MYEIYDKWPNIARKFYSENFDKVNFDGIDHIVFVGMGGSGTIGDIISAILSKENIHVSVIKGYLLPKTVDSETLVVTTSVSGNTLETFSVLKNAHEKNFKTISFSSGGKIENYCKQNQLEFYKIPIFHSPRASGRPVPGCIMGCGIQPG
ncbi:MAG: SIS domain-containing protein [Nitrospinae bacterium]|nr:SIS domain-containing protein [Nitrospinota bacterium]